MGTRSSHNIPQQSTGDPKVWGYTAKTNTIQSNIYRTPCETPTNTIYRTAIEHLSNINRTSIELLSTIYRKMKDKPTNGYRICIEHLTNYYRTSTEHPMNIYRISNKIYKIRQLNTMENKGNMAREKLRPQIRYTNKG